MAPGPFPTDSDRDASYRSVVVWLRTGPDCPADKFTILSDAAGKKPPDENHGRYPSSF